MIKSINYYCLFTLTLITSLSLLLNIDISIILFMYIISILVLYTFKKINNETLLFNIFCIDTIHRIKFTILPIEIYFNQLFLILILCILFTIILLTKQKLKLPKLFLPIFVFLGLNFMFNFINNVPAENNNVAIIMTLSVFEAVIVYNIAEKIPVLKTIKLYLSSFVLCFLLMIVEFIVFPRLGAFSGLIIEPNISGSFFATTIIVLFGVMKASDRTWKNLILMLIFIVGIIMSVTRTSWISLVLCLVIFLLIEKIIITKKINLKYFFNTMIIFIISLITIGPKIIASPKTNLLLYKILNLFELGSGTAAFRFYMFEQAIKTIKHNPFLGRGTSSFGLFYDYNVKMSGLVNEPAYLPNLYISTWFDTGIIGLVIILLFFIFIIIKLWKKINYNGNINDRILSVALLMGFINFLICYNFTSAFWFPSFWNYVIIVILFLNQKTK